MCTAATIVLSPLRSKILNNSYKMLYYKRHGSNYEPAAETETYRFKPICQQFLRFVLRPIAVIAMTIMNLPICTKVSDTDAGIGRNVFNIAVSTKPITNHGNTFIKLKLFSPSSAEAAFFESFFRSVDGEYKSYRYDHQGPCQFYYRSKGKGSIVSCSAAP